MKHKSFFVLCLILASGVVSAQDNVDKRQDAQEQRIDQGIQSGEINKKEEARLERRQERIKRMESKANADGVVTPGEAKHLRRAQNRASHQIRRAKHNNRK